MAKRRVKGPFRLDSENNKEYRVGDYIITNDEKLLKRLEDKDLIEDEDTTPSAEYQAKKKRKTVETADNKEVAEETADLKHVGGGYYELPNGERVQGKDEAIAVLNELKGE